MNNKAYRFDFLPGWMCLLLCAMCCQAEALEYHVVSVSVVAAEPACMPAATRAANGDILVAFSTEWEPFPPGGILKLVRSTDGGKSWSEPEVLFKPIDPKAGAHLGAGMTTLRDGTILLPWQYQTKHKKKNVQPGEKKPHKIYNVHDNRNQREIHLDISKNNGKTWTRKVIYKAPYKHWITNFGRIVELDNGDILLAAYWGKYNQEQNGNEWRAHGFLRSCDGGQTWQMEQMPMPWNSEISPLLLKDGTIIAMLRNNGWANWTRRIFGYTVSRDGGHTWTEPASTGVRGKMPDLVQLPSGRILMGVGAEGISDGVFIFRDKERYSFDTLFISDDNGKSWKKDVAFSQVEKGSTIVPADSPCLVALDDDKVLVVMQALDRAKEKDPLVTYSVGMSLIANVIEPVKQQLNEKQ